MSIERRHKLIGQGIPGNAAFRIENLADGESLKWDSNVGKWIAETYYSADDVDSLLTGYLPLTGGMLTGTLFSNSQIYSTRVSEQAFGQTRAGAGGYFEGVDASGTYAIRQTDDDGISNQKVWLAASRDGGVELRYDNTVRLGTTAGGARIVGADTISLDIDRSGSAVAALINTRCSAGTARFGVASDGALSIQQAAADGTSSVKQWITAGRDGAISLYHNGGKVADTASNGLNIHDPNSTDPQLLAFTSVGGNSWRIFNTTAMGVRSEKSGNNLQLQVTTAGGAVHNAVVCTPDGAASLYNNNVEEFRAADSNGTGRFAGADVKDFDQNFRPVGYGDAPLTVLNANTSLGQTHIGKSLVHSSATAHAWTTPASTDTDSWPVGAWAYVYKRAGAGTCTLTQGSGITIVYFTGSGVSTGNRAMASGSGAAGRLFRASATEFYLTGVGFS